MPTKKATALAISDEKILELSQSFDAAIQQAKDEILRIDEKADFAISVVTQAIKTQATVAKGRVLLQLRERFDQVPQLEGKWLVFLGELELGHQTVTVWMNAARAVNENAAVYGEDLLLGFGGNSLAKLQQFPTIVREAILDDAKESGEIPGRNELAEVSKKPATKLAKALETIEAKAERLAELEAGKEPAYESEKARLKLDTTKLEDTIEQLRSQLAEDKIKREQQEKETERLNAELELLKFDDDAARDQRIKRVANTLIVQLPAVLSDLQKYIAEKEHYETKVVKSLDDSVETLINFLKPLYA